ncbi:hypothetical protein RN001_006598 [Aquatica leii]|uniref:Uncharacterized protein n=1 Tax=Aquatica leii TaxID=1421715 RepID=A0AAN7Q1X0_9COLE|nr:hypothetical protein RN001_006598 [Aquatica leii]
MFIKACNLFSDNPEEKLICFIKLRHNNDNFARTLKLVSPEILTFYFAIKMAASLKIHGQWFDTKGCVMLLSHRR